MTDFGPWKTQNDGDRNANDNVIFRALNWQLLTVIHLPFQATTTPCRLSYAKKPAPTVLNSTTVSFPLREILKSVSRVLGPAQGHSRPFMTASRVAQVKTLALLHLPCQCPNKCSRAGKERAFLVTLPDSRLPQAEVRPSNNFLSPSLLHSLLPTSIEPTRMYEHVRFPHSSLQSRRTASSAHFSCCLPKHTGPDFRLDASPWPLSCHSITSSSHLSN